MSENYVSVIRMELRKLRLDEQWEEISLTEGVMWYISNNHWWGWIGKGYEKLEHWKKVKWESKYRYHDYIVT
jgi:hypothetical protein